MLLGTGGSPSKVHRCFFSANCAQRHHPKIATEPNPGLLQRGLNKVTKNCRSEGSGAGKASTPSGGVQARRASKRMKRAACSRSRMLDRLREKGSSPGTSKGLAQV
jgi:hypothetical protein